MEFTAREDIDVPIEQTFEMLVDFERFERMALRHGAEVTRLDTLSRPGIGAQWQIGFVFRGKKREANLKVTGFDRPNEIVLHADLSSLHADIKVELVALSRTRTRLSIWSGLSATTLSGRLLLQSLKLARGSLTTRLDKRITSFGRTLEERYTNIA